jgi:hypothetical protein
VALPKGRQPTADMTADSGDGRGQIEVDSGEWRQEMWSGWGLPTFVPLLTLDTFRAARAERPLSRYGYLCSLGQTSNLRQRGRRTTDDGQRQQTTGRQQHQAPCRPWDGIHCKCCCESSTLFAVRSASSAYDIDSCESLQQ